MSSESDVSDGELEDRRPPALEEDKDVDDDDVKATNGGDGGPAGAGNNTNNSDSDDSDDSADDSDSSGDGDERSAKRSKSSLPETPTLPMRSMVASSSSASTSRMFSTGFSGSTQASASLMTVSQSQSSSGRQRKDSTSAAAAALAGPSSSSKNEAANDEEPVSHSRHRYRKQFQRELRQMMFGSGDVKNPLPESLDLMEDMTVDFIVQMTNRAVEIAGRRDRVRKDDLLFAIQDHPRMYARAQELLRMNKLVHEVKKFGDTGEGRVKRSRATDE